MTVTTMMTHDTAMRSAMERWRAMLGDDCRCAVIACIRMVTNGLSLSGGAGCEQGEHCDEFFHNGILF